MVSGWKGAIVFQIRVSETKQSKENIPLVQGGTAWHGVLESKKGKEDIHMGGQQPSVRSQRVSLVRRLCVCMCVCVCVCVCVRALPNVKFLSPSEGRRPLYRGKLIVE